MVTGFAVTSPFELNATFPRIEAFSRTLNICFVTSEREPFDCLIACTITSVACAAYTEYGSGTPTALVKLATNALPAPFSDEFGRPATEMVTPCAAEPACLIVAEAGVKPSGSMIFTLDGTPARMSLITFPPFSQIRPPRKTPCAPDCLILTARASYDDALPSHAVKPTVLMPSLVAAFRKLVATPRP